MSWPAELLSNTDIDQAYNPAFSIPDAAAQMRFFTEASTAVLNAGGTVQNLRYGEDETEYLDIYPAIGANGRAPIHLFIHGGFWRAFSAKDYAFVAPPFAQHGICTAVLNYALCPSITIPEIIAQCRAAVGWLWHNARHYGADPAYLTISGHSAGAHLTAMLAATDWTAYQLPADIVKAICPVSGIFDLAPLALSWLQPLLLITPEIIAAASPLYHPPRCGIATSVYAGAEETTAFHRQSQAYFENVLQAGGHATCQLLSGCNHINILNEFAAGGALYQAITRMAHNNDSMN